MTIILTNIGTVCFVRSHTYNFDTQEKVTFQLFAHKTEGREMAGGRIRVQKVV